MRFWEMWWNLTAKPATVTALGIFSAIICSPVSSAIDSRVANTSLTVPEIPETFGYQTENALPGLTFTRPVAAVTRPGDDDTLFIVEQGGIIYSIPDIANPTKEVFLDISANVLRNNNEEGLYCLAFHPDWETNGYFFVHYSTTATTTAGSGRHGRISRFQIDPADDTQALASSEQPLISQFDEKWNHNGGELKFGLDGYLYASLGDEGGSGDQYNNSRYIDKDYFSAILRIDVDKLPGNLEPNAHPAVHLDGSDLAYYSIPADNPFIGSTSFNGESIDPDDVRTEFWAVGLRNPWRFSFDEYTGLLYCADVGQNAYEEVNIVTKGGDYGWRLREGSHAYNGNTVPAGVELKDPILEYPHYSGSAIPGPNGKAEGRSVTGGIVYHGNRISQLESYYVFGDYISNRIFAFHYDSTSEATENFQQLTTVIDPVSFGTDPSNGEILIVSLSGTIYRLLYSDTPLSGDPIPSTLSATGTFSDLTTLTPETGIEPYDINVPFWSDHAIKSRWFSVPDLADTIGFDESENWTFPDGAVWIKHFDMEMVEDDPNSRRRLETRFLVKNSEGIHGFTYKWNAEETEAFLVAEEGEDELLTILDSEGGVVRNQTWRYPSRSECLQCHTSVGGYALGFGNLQLNKSYDYGSGPINQIDALDDAGYFDVLAPDPSTIEKIVPTSDSSSSIEEKARSYLHSNCVQCHQPGGPSQGSWDAQFLTSLGSAGIIDGELVNNNGDPDKKVIASGDIDHSMILQRISVRGSQQMPPLGSNELDQDGINIITSWIQSLSTSASPSLTQSRSSFTFTEGDGATVIDGGITVTDTDTTDFNGGSLTIRFTGQDGVDDVLDIENQGSGSGQIGIAGNTVSYEGNNIGTFAGGGAFLNPLIISFDNSTPIAAVTALSQAITYDNPSSTPLTFDRTIEFTLIDDSSQSSNTLSYTVSVNSDAEDPIIDWADPSEITFGTPLSSTQLNASANVPGTFVYDPDVGTLLNAGDGQSLEATFTPDDLDNYNVVVANATIDVAKASATLTADNDQRPYGAANPTFSFSANGLVAGDTTGDIDTPPTLSTSAVNSSPVGSYSITISGASDSNYDFSYTAGELTIEPAPLTITADNKARIYGQSNPPLTATYSGFVLNEGPEDLDTPVSLFTSATLASPSGSYAITASGATSTNYSITHQNGVFDIAKASATITAADDQKTYGDPNPAFSFTVSGLVNGDTIGDIDTSPVLTSTATQSSPTGTYSIDPSGAAANNYSFSYVPGTLTVEPATLTITADDKARGFGQPNPPLTVSYSGFVLGEGPADLDTAPTLQTAADEASPVGDYAIDVSGAVDANYDFAFQSGTLSVGKAVATITVNDAQKTYGSGNPAFSFTVSGLLNGDTAEDIDTPPTLATAASATSPTGAYAITAAGASDADYDFVYSPGTLNVEPAHLTITADDKTRVYGELNPPLTATYSGFVLGEGTENLDTPAGMSTDATSASPAGSYSITPSAAASNNYAFNYLPGTLTVGKATATLTADDTQKTYGLPNPAFSFTVSGLVNGDISIEDIDVPPTLGTLATEASAPGDYDISISGASDPNYDFAYEPGTLDVDPAPLTISADDKERTFGQANPELTASYSGFVLGEGPEDLDTTAVLQTTATTESPSDLYEITVSGASDPSYAITFQSGYLSVGRTLVTLTADNQQRSYGDPNPEFAYTASGFMNGDTIADIDTPPTLSTTATQASDVGTYSIDINGAEDANYFFSHQLGTLEIEPAPLSVSTPDQIKPYGSANPEFSIEYEGFVLDDTEADLDTVPTAITPALVDSPVGEFSIKLSGGSDPNYTFNYTPATLTVEPTRLTISADNKSRDFGLTNPNLTASYSGFVLNEGAQHLDTQPTLETEATVESPIGLYDILISGAGDPNYQISFEKGYLSIGKRLATLTAVNLQREYGSENPPLSYSATGLIEGETAAEIDVQPTLSTDAEIDSPVGTYTINVSGAEDPSYNFVYKAGELEVLKKTLTAKANDHSSPYGSPNPEFSINFEGFVLEDDSSSLDTLPETSTEATTESVVGEYEIKLSGGADNNYSFIYESGTLTVTPVPLTIRADDKIRSFQTPNPPLTANFSGFVLDDDANIFDTPVDLDTNATIDSKPGQYPITVSGVSSTNYAIEFIDGTLSIGPGNGLMHIAIDSETGEPGIQFTGVPDSGYIIESSGDLEIWEAFDNVATDEFGFASYTLPEGFMQAGHKFFRVFLSQSE